MDEPASCNSSERACGGETPDHPCENTSLSKDTASVESGKVSSHNVHSSESGDEIVPTEREDEVKTQDVTQDDPGADQTSQLTNGTSNDLTDTEHAHGEDVPSPISAPHTTKEVLCSEAKPDKEMEQVNKPAYGADATCSTKEVAEEVDHSEEDCTGKERLLAEDGSNEGVFVEENPVAANSSSTRDQLAEAASSSSTRDQLAEAANNSSTRDQLVEAANSSTTDQPDDEMDDGIEHVGTAMEIEKLVELDQEDDELGDEPRGKDGAEGIFEHSPDSEEGDAGEPEQASAEETARKDLAMKNSELMHDDDDDDEHQYDLDGSTKDGSKEGPMQQEELDAMKGDCATRHNSSQNQDANVEHQGNQEAVGGDEADKPSLLTAADDDQKEDDKSKIGMSPPREMNDHPLCDGKEEEDLPLSVRLLCRQKTKSCDAEVESEEDLALSTRMLRGRKTKSDVIELSSDETDTDRNCSPRASSVKSRNIDIDAILRCQPRIVLKRLDVEGLYVPPVEKIPSLSEVDSPKSPKYPTADLVSKAHGDPDVLVNHNGFISCPVCRNKAYEHWSKLHRHIRQVHPDIPTPYRCAYCNLGVYKLINLKIHIARKHSANYDASETEYQSMKESLPKHNSFSPARAKKRSLIDDVQETYDVSLPSPNVEKMFGCPLCDLEWKRNNDLDVHFRKIHGNNMMPFQCVHCRRGFFFKTSWSSHIRSFHANGKDRLNVTSSAAGKVLPHDSASQIYHCRVIVDGKEIKSSDASREINVTCHICKVNFELASELHQHKCDTSLVKSRVASPKRSKGEHELKTEQLSTAKKAKIDIPVKKKNEIMDSPTRAHASAIGIQKLRIELLQVARKAKIDRQAKKKRENVVSPPKGSLNTVSKKNLEKISEEVEKLISAKTCPECRRQFTKHMYLDEHYRWEHKDKEMPQPCPVCKLGFMTKTSRNQHLQNVHAISKADLADYDSPHDKVDTKSATSANADSGASVQEGSKDVVNDSTKDAALMRCLKNHLCPEGCGHFPSIDELEEHYKANHDQSKMPHHCHRCKSTSFFSKRRLIKHYRWCRGPASPEFAKHRMNFEEAYGSHMTIRKTTHSFKGLRAAQESLICPKCSQTFRTMTYLEAHYRTQHDNGNMPFSCKICKKSFFLRKRLAGHIKVCHTDIVGKYVKKSKLRHPKSARAKLNVVQAFQKVASLKSECPECKQICTNKRRLLIHYRLRHDSKKLPFKCELCDQRFFTSGDKDRHLRYANHTRWALGKEKKESPIATSGSSASNKPERADVKPKPKCMTEAVVKLEKLPPHMLSSTSIQEKATKVLVNESVHDKYKNVSNRCPECKLKCADGKSLTSHFNTMHKEMKMPFVCVTCSKGFFHLRGAMSHTRKPCIGTEKGSDTTYSLSSISKMKCMEKTPKPTLPTAGPDKEELPNESSMDNAKCHMCGVSISVDKKHRDLGQLQGIARIRFYCKACKVHRSTLKNAQSSSQSSVQKTSEATLKKTPPKPPPRRSPKRPPERVPSDNTESDDERTEDLESELMADMPLRQQPKRQRIEVKHYKPELPKCPECGKTYETERGRDGHFRKDHSELTMPYVCAICSLGYLTPSSLSAHEKKCRAAASEHTTSKPKEVKKSKYVVCPECQQTFSGSYKRDDHYRNIHGQDNMPLRCHLCQRGFFTKELIVTHFIRRHRLKKDEIHRQLEGAPDFQETYTTEPYKPSSEGKSQKARKDPSGGEGGFIFCSQCLKVFSSQEKRNEHVRVVHKKGHPCNLCGQGFKTIDDLSTHISSTHMGSSMSVVKSKNLAGAETDSDSNDTVSYCGSDSFRGSSDAAPETRQKMFDCPKCSASFAVKRMLKVHIEQEHKERSLSLNCPTCGTNYDSHSSLMLHCKIRKHGKYGSDSGESTHQKWSHLFKQTQAGAKTSTTNDEGDNSSSHSNQTSKKTSVIQDSVVQATVVQDSLIQDSFVRDSVIQDSVVQDTVIKDSFVKDMHIKDSNVINKNQGFECKVCSFKFRTQVNLEQHINTFHGSNAADLLPYKCTKCSRGFFIKSVMLGHHSVCKGKDSLPRSTAPSTATGTASAATTSTEAATMEIADESPLQCPEVGCDMQFMSEISRELHYCTAHGKGKKTPFKCFKCGEVFFLLPALKKHFLENHQRTPLSSDFQLQGDAISPSVSMVTTGDSSSGANSPMSPVVTSVQNVPMFNEIMVTTGQPQPVPQPLMTLVLNSSQSTPGTDRTESSASGQARPQDNDTNSESSESSQYPPIKCPVCTKPFYSDTILKSHCKCVHDNLSPPYSCRHCRATFMQLHRIVSHWKVVHEQRYKEDVRGTFPCKQTFYMQCLECFQKCSTVVKFEDHVNLCHNNKKHNYTDICLRIKHLILSHYMPTNTAKLLAMKLTGDMTLGCPYCKKRVKTAQEMEGHVTSTHPDVRQVHKCHECQDTFYLRDSLETHYADKHRMTLPSGTNLQVSTVSNHDLRYSQAVDKVIAWLRFHLYAKSEDWVWVCCAVCGKLFHKDVHRQAAHHVLEFHSLPLSCFGAVLFGYRPRPELNTERVERPSDPQSVHVMRMLLEGSFKDWGDGDVFEVTKPVQKNAPETPRQKRRTAAKRQPIETIIIDDDDEEEGGAASNSIALQQDKQQTIDLSDAGTAEDAESQASGASTTAQQGDSSQHDRIQTLVNLPSESLSPAGTDTSSNTRQSTGGANTNMAAPLTFDLRNLAQSQPAAPRPSGGDLGTVLPSGVDEKQRKKTTWPDLERALLSGGDLRIVQPSGSDLETVLPSADHSATLVPDLGELRMSQRVEPPGGMTEHPQPSHTRETVTVRGLQNPIIIAPDDDFVDTGFLPEVCLVCGDPADRSTAVAQQLPASCLSCRNLAQTYNPILAPECPTMTCEILPASTNQNCDYCRFHRAASVGLLKDGLLSAMIGAQP